MIKSGMVIPGKHNPTLDLAVTVLNCMHDAEANPLLKSGEDKREYVMTCITNSIHTAFGEGQYSQLVQQLVPHLIEFIVDVSHSEVVININKKCKNKFISWCK